MWFGQGFFQKVTRKGVDFPSLLKIGAEEVVKFAYCNIQLWKFLLMWVLTFGSFRRPFEETMRDDPTSVYTLSIFLGLGRVTKIYAKKIASATAGGADPHCKS